MKKIVLLTLAACAALVSTSCSKSYDMTEETTVGGIQIVADMTRTTNDGMHTLWAANDAINLFYAATGTTSYSSNYKYTTAEAGTSARFTGDVAELGSDKLDWFAMYPYNSKQTTPADCTCYFNIGCNNSASTAQVQNGNNSMAHLAGEYFPVYAKTTGWDPTKADNTVALSFKPMLSIVKFVVKNTTSKPVTVSALSMTAEEDIVGSYYINFTGDAPVFTLSKSTYVSNTAKLSVSGGEAIACNSTAEFYMAIKPFTASGEKTYKFSVNGYEKSINLTDAVFAAGKIRTVNFNFDQEEKDFGGTYVVLAKKGTTYYAMSGEPGSSSFMPMVDFTYDGTTSPVPVSNPAIVWDVEKAESGYTLKCRSNSKYLSYSGSGNSARVLDTVDETAYMTMLQQSDSTFSITNTKVSARSLRCNVDASRYAFYTSATGIGDLNLVKATYDSTPVLNPITNPAKVASTGATGVSVSYTVTNPVAGRTATASTTESWIKDFDWATYGTITFNVEANSLTTERSGVVTVSYDGAKSSVTFTVTQSASGVIEPIVLDLTAKTAKHNVYSDTWAYGDWNITYGSNNNASWAYVKMGAKNTALKNPCTIDYSNKVTDKISEITVHLPGGSLSTAGMSVTEWGVYVYSDDSMTQQVDYVAGGEISSSAASFSFKPTSDKTWKDCYVRVAWTIANTSSANGVVYVDNVTIKF